MDAQASTSHPGIVADHPLHRDGGWAAVPAVDRDAEIGPVLLTIDVDGEQFAVRKARDGGWAYEWLSGPNPGYGFAISGPTTPSAEEHRHAIRSFLQMIDPATGYIEDD